MSSQERVRIISVNIFFDDDVLAVLSDQMFVVPNNFSFQYDKKFHFCEPEDSGLELSLKGFKNSQIIRDAVISFDSLACKV